jgi:hypothetical protein
MRRISEFRHESKGTTATYLPLLSVHLKESLVLLLSSKVSVHILLLDNVPSEGGNALLLNPVVLKERTLVQNPPGMGMESGSSGVDGRRGRGS